MRKAEVDFASKQATVTADAEAYDEDALIAALEEAGFGGSVAAAQGQDGEETARLPRVTFEVRGMKKTRSGAT